MNRVRILMLLLTIIIVGSIGLFASYYARGYRIDPKTLKWTPNGLLVVKSDPEAAQVFVDGVLKTATNTTLSLAPGSYNVEVKKEGYRQWQKIITIEKEEVTQVEASLFKSAPSLSAVTFFSSNTPVASEDFTKIIYQVPAAKLTPENTGLWIIETLNLPLGFSRAPRRVTDGDLTNYIWEISPDGRNVLLYSKTAAYLLDVGQFTPQTKRVALVKKLDQVHTEWQTEQKMKLSAQIKTTPKEMAEILDTKTTSVIFSPDQDMVLYTASASALIPEKLIQKLPGSSTQKEERDIKKDRTYIYDIKEDKNFLIDTNSKDLVLGSLKASPSAKRRIAWFPTSRHILLAENEKVSIIDYDGTNKQTVYTGSYLSPNAFPTLSKDRIIILTNLGANSEPANLFSLSIK